MNEISEMIIRIAGSPIGRYGVIFMYGVAPVVLGWPKKRSILILSVTLAALLSYVDLIAMPSLGHNLFAPLPTWGVFALPIIISAVLTTLHKIRSRQTIDTGGL